MSRKYKFEEQEAVYFVSFATVEWVDVFTRREYKDIIIDSLNYCRAKKGLIIYAYVIMSNHLHLLISREPNSRYTLSDIMRDLKKYTSVRLLDAIRENANESRKEWMLDIFRTAGEKNSHNTTYQLWRQDNHPLCLSEHDDFVKVLAYIHDNPVLAGWSNTPEEYWYSSARNYTNMDSPLKVTGIYDGTEI